MKTGLVSVTFRSFSPEKIISLAADAGLEAIEWGGDVHVPPGRFDAAEEISCKCSERGIVPTGYGSYYNAADAYSGFPEVLETAVCLGATYVRIWAGRGKNYDSEAEVNIKRAVLAAGKKGLYVSLECHRNTMTENRDIAVKLAKNTGCRLHFQPNPDISFGDNLKTAEAFAPHLAAVHVFAWEKGPENRDVRLPLADHFEEWKAYKNSLPGVPFLLEFVKDDLEKSFFGDAETLKKLAAF